LARSSADPLCPLALKRKAASCPLRPLSSLKSVKKTLLTGAFLGLSMLLTLTGCKSNSKPAPTDFEPVKKQPTASAPAPAKFEPVPKKPMQPAPVAFEPVSIKAPAPAEFEPVAPKPSEAPAFEPLVKMPAPVAFEPVSKPATPTPAEFEPVQKSPTAVEFEKVTKTDAQK